MSQAIVEGGGRQVHFVMKLNWRMMIQKLRRGKSRSSKIRSILHNYRSQQLQLQKCHRAKVQAFQL